MSLQSLHRRLADFRIAIARETPEQKVESGASQGGYVATHWKVKALGEECVRLAIGQTAS